MKVTFSCLLYNPWLQVYTPLRGRKRMNAECQWGADQRVQNFRQWTQSRHIERGGRGSKLKYWSKKNLRNHSAYHKFHKNCPQIPQELLTNSTRTAPKTVPRQPLCEAGSYIQPTVALSNVWTTHSPLLLCPMSELHTAHCHSVQLPELHTAHCHSVQLPELHTAHCCSVQCLNYTQPTVALSNCLNYTQPIICTTT
jgi:hypothetical protein